MHEQAPLRVEGRTRHANAIVDVTHFAADTPAEVVASGQHATSMQLRARAELVLHLVAAPHELFDTNCGLGPSGEA